MNAVGIIFADSYDVDIDDLMKTRTLASLPFGGRYRIIDFQLSDMANSGIRNIAVITTQRYQSLMDHIGAGDEWDLDRKTSQLKIIPPLSMEKAKSVYKNRLEALQANVDYLRDRREKYVVVTGCNYVGNIDFQAMIDFHEKMGADITGLCVRNPYNKENDVDSTIYTVNSDGFLTDIKIGKNNSPDSIFATNAYVMEREYLINELERTEAQHKTSFRMDVIAPAIKKGRVAAYVDDETILFMDNLTGYLKANIALLDNDIRKEIFARKDKPIITKVKDSAPAEYGPEADVTDSLIADGSRIEGKVVNSIIFRGVHIKKGAVIENSVIMQDSSVGENVELNYAILDKNVIINDGRKLSGYITHPFFVGRDEVI